MARYYQNRLPIKTEGVVGDIVGGTYRGVNFIAVKAPEKWVINIAFPLTGQGNNETTIKFSEAGSIVFRNAYNEKVVTINDKGLEVHIT
jgi:hypothetical protein